MSQVQSPFKFLDAYQKADAAVFFGRDKETNELYRALNGVKHLLVYGPSGSGKTSLVECGLRNQFSDADCYAITIRKGNDINTSVFETINKSLTEKFTLDPETRLPGNPLIGFTQAVETLFDERYQPVYLLFDQFEELLISGQPLEKENFFVQLNKLIRSKIPCRIILIMREEFIGHLSEFEALCPTLFQYRFRVEKMGRKNVEEVITHILEAPVYQNFFRVTNSKELAESILSKLPDQKKEIELAHVQVFLGELWDRALLHMADTKDNGLPILSDQLIKEDDNLETILESFLKKQMAELELSFGQNVPLEVLAAMITDRFTKLQLSEASLSEDLSGKKVNLIKPLLQLLKELEQRRIIRSLKTGDEQQYEISHDLLALVVGQNLTEDMKLREKAGEIYKVYLERQGLFTQDDLDYLRPYEKFLAYPQILEEKIQDSLTNIALEKALQQEQILKEQKALATKKQLQKTRVFLGITLIALFLAGYFYSLVLEQKQKIDEYTKKQSLTTESNSKIKKTADSLKKVAETNLIELDKFIRIDLNGMPLRDSAIKNSILERLSFYLPQSVNIKRADAEDQIKGNAEAIIIPGHFYSIDLLQKLMPSASETNLHKFILTFNKSTEATNINTPLRFASFMAAVAYESNELNNLESPIIESTISEENKLYRERGIFKIRTKDRYIYYSKELHFDLLKNPDSLKYLEIATPVACFIWTNEWEANPLADNRDIINLFLSTKTRYDKTNKFYENQFRNYYNKSCSLFNAQ